MADIVSGECFAGDVCPTVVCFKAVLKYAQSPAVAGLRVGRPPETLHNLATARECGRFTAALSGPIQQFHGSTIQGKRQWGRGGKGGPGRADSEVVGEFSV